MHARLSALVARAAFVGVFGLPAVGAGHPAHAAPPVAHTHGGRGVSCNAAGSPVIRTDTVGGAPNAIVVDEQTHRAFVANHASNSVHVLDTATGALLRTVTVRGGPQAMAVDSRTNLVFVVDSGNSTVSVLTATGGTLVRAVRVSYFPLAVAVAARMDRVFVADYGSGRVSMLNAHDGTVLRTVVLGGNPSVVLVDEQTNRVFVGANGNVHVLDATTGTRLRTMDAGMHVEQMAVDEPTGDVVIAGTGPAVGRVLYTTRIAVLDAVDGRVLRTIQIGRYALASMEDAQNGNLFISQVNSGTIIVLALRSGAVARRTAVPQGIGYMELDSPANRVFVPSYGPTTSAGTLSVLDATTGLLVRSVRVGAYPIAVAVDEQTRYGFVANMGNGTRTGTGSITVLNATC